MAEDPRLSGPRIIVALDTPFEQTVATLITHLDPALCRLKVGKELFTAAGPALVGQLKQRGFDVFLDLKFHDIPNTCAAAVRQACKLGVWMVNVHASGGVEMMEASRAVMSEFEKPPLLIAVTVLTSFDEQGFAKLSTGRSIADTGDHLTGLAITSGLDGVVCSVHEVARLKRTHGNACLTVTPGIRPAGEAADDQRRIATPAEARKAGSDFLVVGRPITQAREPGKVLRAMVQELEG